MSNAYEEGKAGRAMTPGGDASEYRKGEQAREKSEFLASLPKTQVSGVSFTILLMSPLIWMPYPVLGFTLLGVFGLTVFIMRLLPLPGFLEFLIGIVPCVAAFFLGFMWERVASSLKPYRAFRSVWRFAISVVVTSALLTGGLKHSSFDQVAPGAWIAGFIAAFAALFLFGLMDRIYFPAASEILKAQTLAAAGVKPERNAFKRYVVWFLWLIPVMVVMNTIIRLAVGLFTTGPEATHNFYMHYSLFVYAVDFIVWGLLCFKGKLPGCGKYVG